MKRLENKIALITGGSGGIGYATAKEFIAQGAEVIITGRNPSKLDTAVQSLGHKTHGIISDAADMKAIAQLPEKVRAFTRILDILFVNAASYTIAPFEQHTEASYDAIQNSNAKGVFFIIQKLLPLIPPGGSIILNGTISVNQTLFGISPLIAAKAAITSLGKALANELAAKSIRVNTVSPGAIKTPGAMKTAASFLGVETLTPEHLEAFSKQILPGIPMKRLGEPEEIAKAVLFFASDDSSYVTGSDLVIDGGKSIAW